MNTGTEEVSAPSEKKDGRRMRHAKQNPSEALGIIESAMFRGEKHGISFALMNIPGKHALGIVVAGAYHCSKCKQFVYGPTPASEKCPTCEGK